MHAVPAIGAAGFHPRPPIRGYHQVRATPSVLSMTATTSTLRRAQRSLTPDLARGAMLAAIALANVMIYLYDRPYGLRHHIVEDGVLDQAVTAVLTATVDARAYPMFAVLYGYGLARIVATRTARCWPEAQVRSYLRRRSVGLVALGAVHALLAFSGDILGWYGLLGLLLGGASMRWSDRRLLVTAAVALPPAAIVQGLIYADPEVRLDRAVFWSVAIEEPVAATMWRGLEWLMAPFGLLAVISALLVGVLAGRRDLLTEVTARRRSLGRVAGVGILLGWLGGLPMALATAHVVSLPAGSEVAFSTLHILTGVPAGLGYAALAGWLGSHHRFATSRAARALQATGARSLSCYLAQSVVFAALLPAWSLGLGATLGTAAAAGVAVLTWLATVVLASVLEHRGQHGPAERLLRSFARPRAATMR